MKVLNYHRLTVIFINKTYIPSDHQTKCSRNMPRLLGYTAHSCIISILSILENWLHFPFFTCGILLLGPQGRKHQNYAPLGLRRMGRTPDMVKLMKHNYFILTD